MLERVRSQCQCLQKKGQNSNVRKDKITMPMFTKIEPEFQC